MRCLPNWTLGDLEATAEISRSNAESFVYALMKAGYVRCIQPRRSGVKGGYAVYRLINNTGPRCPVTANYNAVIHDRNTGKDTIIGKSCRDRYRVTTRVTPTNTEGVNHVA